MYLNGDIKFIHAFHDDIVVASSHPDKLVEEIEVNQLEVFLPEPGMYVSKTNSGLLQLKKTTAKQWKKSFNPDLYFFNVLSASTDQDFYVNNYSYIKEPFIEFKDFIYLGHTVYKVASIKGSDVTCTDLMFYQELSDYIKRKELPWVLK